jgi:formate hydrogenlyase subunit 3/multisubunit Na+/H+ antiporter MnhD subunit
MNVHEISGAVTIHISWYAILPLLSIFIPILGSLLILIFHKREKMRNALVVSTTLLDFLTVILMYKPVIEGIKKNGHLYRYLEYRLPTLLDLGINFKVDAVSLLIGLVTSFIWLLSCIYATSYMSAEHARTRYFFFALLTLAANLGILFTKDFFSLFLFFELMAIFSFVLVVHEETKEAMEAGYLYLFMCIIGGLALLAGIVLMYIYTGTAEIKPIYRLLEENMPTPLRYLMATLMTIGFGTKAGVFFLHVWLPEAHPIAPTPASALLSGLIIKAGAYGILRTVNTLFAPVEVSSYLRKAAESGILTNLGYWLIWLGVITMFFGVVNALLSANCKRMLAYHSISQMGYIVLGLGCAAFLGEEGAMGLAGAIYHIVNHALFKSALFLSVGAVYFRTRELDMYKLGGMWRNMPFVAVACFIAVMGISGVPLFNGFASKTILHHAIIEAYEHTISHHPDLWLIAAEVFFCLTAFGTFCSNVKMWLFVFVWRQPEKFKDTKPAPLSMQIALGALSAAILFIGIKPNWLLEKFIGPALTDFGFNPSSHAYHILYNAHIEKGIRSTIPLLYDPKTLSFLNLEVVHNLLAGGLVILGGGMTFILGYRFGWFHVEPPEWISVKYWYILLAKGFSIAISRPSQVISQSVDNFYYFIAREFLAIPFKLSHLRRKIKNNLIPIVFGLSEETQVSLWQLELANFLEKERRDSIRRLMRHYHLELIRKGVPAKERGEKLQKEKREAYEEAQKIVETEEQIIKKSEEAMVMAGIARARRRESLLNLCRLLSEIRKNGNSKNSLKRLKTVRQIIPQITAKRRGLLGKDIVISLAQEIKENIMAFVEEGEFWEKLLDKAVQEIFQVELSYRRIEKGILEKTAGWFRKMMRIAAEILTEERVPWEVERYVSQKEVAEARAAIRRYTRDMSLNLLVIILLIMLIAILTLLPLSK